MLRFRTNLSLLNTLALCLVTLSSCEEGSNPVCTEQYADATMPANTPGIQMARDYLSTHPLVFRATPSDSTKLSYVGGGLANEQATWTVNEELGAATQVTQKLTCPSGDCPPIGINCPPDRLEAIVNVTVSWSPSGETRTLSNAKTWVGPSVTILPNGKFEYLNTQSTHFTGSEQAQGKLDFEFTGRNCNPDSKHVRWHLQYHHQDQSASAKLFAVARCSTGQSSEMEDVEMLMFSASPTMSLPPQ